MQIRVNADDRCFGSILSLYRGGFLEVTSGPKLIESVTDGKIVTPSAEFVLRRAGERSVSEHADDGIGAGGATWFAGLRGEDVEITKKGAKVRTFVLPTNEEYMIALDTYNLAK